MESRWGYMSKFNKNNKKSVKKNRNNFKIESLEPRLMMDAAAIITLAP